jgi:hypothetical protein
VNSYGNRSLRREITGSEGEKCGREKRVEGKK